MVVHPTPCHKLTILLSFYKCQYVQLIFISDLDKIISMQSHEEHKASQRASMEKQRFGYTREEVLKAKGATCVYPGGDHEGDLVIDHITGGGRHDTERGLLKAGKTHSLSNMRVLCRKHAGLIDRKDFIQDKGSNTRGNPNNKSQ